MSEPMSPERQCPAGLLPHGAAGAEMCVVPPPHRGLLHRTAAGREWVDDLGEAEPHTPMPPERLAEIAARAEAATPGPWCTDGWEIYQGTEYVSGSVWIGETCDVSDAAKSAADAAFIAAAREDVPALLADNARLRTELARYVGSEPTVAEEMGYLSRCLDAVLNLCDRAEHEAARWENPLPVPEWVAQVRAAAEGSAGGHEVSDLRQQLKAAHDRCAEQQAELADARPARRDPMLAARQWAVRVPPTTDSSGTVDIRDGEIDARAALERWRETPTGRDAELVTRTVHLGPWHRSARREVRS